MLHSDKITRRKDNIDHEKERSEKLLTTMEFLVAYNKDLPESFPRATNAQLNEFMRTFPSLFKNKEYWTLHQHRKKVMDWLQQIENRL